MLTKYQKFLQKHLPYLITNFWTANTIKISVKNYKYSGGIDWLLLLYNIHSKQIKV